MEPKKEIAIREADLGPVIARADHQDWAIEVNSKIFYKLPPMVQEFVLCHEVCHLWYDEPDENRANALATELFMSRAVSEADANRRREFVSYMDTRGGYSNFAWGALAAAVISLGTTVYGIISNRNAGWYKWDEQTQRSNLTTMLTTAFEQARRTSRYSAADYFWAQMQNYTNKDDSLDEFLNRSKNAWVKTEVAKYEKKYGRGFKEVKMLDITAFPLAIAAIILAVAAAVYFIVRKKKKK